MRAVPHQLSLSFIPLALLACAFATGILATRLISLDPVISLSLTGSVTVIALGALWKNYLRLAALAIVTGVVLLGMALMYQDEHTVPQHRLKRLLADAVIQPGEPIEVAGSVERPPEVGPGLLYVDLKTEEIRLRDSISRASGVVRLSFLITEAKAMEYEILELRYGARLRVMTTLERADKYRNPGVSSFTEYLDRKGYDATAFVKSPLLIQRLDDRKVFLPLAWLYDWRQVVQKRIHRTFSPETAGVLAASMLGNRHNLSRSSTERFREGGTFHVLVISGLHISVIGGVVMFLVRRFTRDPKWQFVLSTTVLWSYTLAVGAEVSVLRAAFMFSILAFAPVVSRRGLSVNTLGAAALLQLAYQPSQLFDPSFQLTFLAVAAIVVIALPLLERMAAIGSWRPARQTPAPPAVAPWLRELSEILFWNERDWQKDLAQSTHHCRLFKSPLALKLGNYRLQALLRYTFAGVIVSVSVQLALVPLFIIHFHRLSVVSIILNIAVSVLMAALSVVALLALIVSLVSTGAAAVFVAAANGLNWLMLHSVDPFVSLGISSLRLPEYSNWFAALYFAYYIPLAILAVRLGKWNPLDEKGARWRLLVLVQVALLALLVAHPWSKPRVDGLLHIAFLDVGQGDAALLTMPDGTLLLIDAGGRPEFNRNDDEEEPFERDTRSVGEAVVSEYLWYRGFDSVDFLLATHADTDHIDGLNDIVRNFNVRAGLVGRTPTADAEYAKFAATMHDNEVPIAVLGASDLLRFGGVTIEVMWPPLSERADATSMNNDSLVLLIRFGERALLMTGDIEAGTEARLVQRGRLRADLVKVAHHGSKTSSTEAFVGAVHAKWAIISVGQTSIFEHPHPVVVERWKAAGAEVMTTGRSGTITVVTDGRDLKVESFVR